MVTNYHIIGDYTTLFKFLKTSLSSSSETTSISMFSYCSGYLVNDFNCCSRLSKRINFSFFKQKNVLPQTEGPTKFVRLHVSSKISFFCIVYIIFIYFNFIISFIPINFVHIILFVWMVLNWNCRLHYAHFISFHILT